MSRLDEAQRAHGVALVRLAQVVAEMLEELQGTPTAMRHDVAGWRRETLDLFGAMGLDDGLASRLHRHRSRHADVEPCRHEGASGLMVANPHGDGVVSTVWKWCSECGALASDGAPWSVPKGPTHPAWQELLSAANEFNIVRFADGTFECRVRIRKALALFEYRGKGETANLAAQDCREQVCRANPIWAEQPGTSQAGASPGSQEHTLKTWALFWDAVNEGRKTFELRRRDRDFFVGDTLALVRVHGYPPHAPTCDPPPVIRRRISYITSGAHFGLQDGFVCLGLAPVGGAE